MTVPLSLCDSTGRLGEPGVFSLFMDMATEHAESLGIGLEAMSRKHFFWLTVRTRIRFRRRPRLLEETELVTWPEKAGAMRCDRDYLLRTPGGEILAEGKTEWAVLDTRTGRPAPMRDVYPEELTAILTEDTVWTEPFTRIREDFSDGEEFGTYTVSSADIDVGGHMNNAAYLRMLLGSFSTEERKAMTIRELEVCFRAPCFEGEKLTLRRRRSGGGWEAAALRPDGKAALLAVIRTEEKE